VVKEMLRRAYSQTQEHLSNAVQNVRGIMFFGTPHSGADPRSSLLKVAEKAYRALGYTPNQQIVDSLLPSSERLRELRDTFGILAERNRWTIHSFQEQYAVKAIGGKVVEDGSSYLNLPSVETTEHIGRDHMGMSRFSGLDDPEFSKVAAALRRMTQALQQPTPATLHQQSSTSPSASSRAPEAVQDPVDIQVQAGLDEFLEFLYFDQIDARHDNIKKAHAKTCKWLTGNPEYKAWLDPSRLSEHHGFLWIKGKPGSGKSTLMKFALAQLKRTYKNRTILNFFFNARGEELEKSTKGLYRSLLLQLLEQCPELQSTVGKLIKPRSFTVSNEGDRRSQWGIELLKTAFEQAIEAIGHRSVTCVIDALDECDESEVRDMVSFFEDLGELPAAQAGQFSICLSSRRYPHITISHGVELVLDGLEGHVQDITNYIQSMLKIGTNKRAAAIREKLQEKASGVFMWVVLVVDILNREYDKGKVHSLQQTLDKLPADLNQLFLDIINRDSHGKEELLLCIQWILFARKPLKPGELYYAILSGSNDLDSLSPCEDGSPSLEDMSRFILDCSKGLAETTKTKAATVQFIHESVRDFLVKEDGLVSIWPSLSKEFEGKSHDELKKCCRSYLSSVSNDTLEAILLTDDSSRNKEREIALAAFPFLDYAVRNVLYHTDKAEEFNVCQKEFMASFPWDRWIQQHNAVEKYSTRRYAPDTRPLYILAEHGLENLVPREFSIEACMRDQKTERYYSALGAALATRNMKTVQILRTALIAMLPLFEGSRMFLNDKNHSDHSIWAKYEWTQKPKLYTGTPKLIAEAEDPCLMTTYFCCQYYTLLGTKQTFHERAFMDDVAVYSLAVTKHRTLLKILLWLFYFHRNQISFDLGIFVDADHESITSIDTNNHQDCGHFKVTVERPSLQLGEGLAAASSAVHEESTITQHLQGAPLRTMVEVCPRVVAYLMHMGDISIPDLLSWLEPGDYHLVLFAILVELDGAITRQLWPKRLPSRELQITPPEFYVEGHAPSLSKIPQSELLLVSGLSALIGDHGTLKACIETKRWKINTPILNGQTCLHLASLTGYCSIVRLIMDMDITRLNILDEGGRTPLFLACRQGHEGVVELLLKAENIDPNSVDHSQRPEIPLHIAIHEGHDAIAKLLLERVDIDVNAISWDHDTPLHTAIRVGRDAIAKLLLERVDIDVNAMNLNHETPIHMAIRLGHDAIAKLLLERVDIEVNVTNHRDDTLLHTAIRVGHDAIAKLLLERVDIDVNVTDQLGQTPLALAKWKKGDRGIVDLLLLRAGALDAI
jgi:ankyrin repeat protein